MERIVVIGGGFAGLNFIKHIDRKRFEVIVVDRNNYHSFPPLFYQVASAGLEPASISFPFRREMRKKHIKGVKYNYGCVKTIDLARRCVVTQFETVPFDKLVIAAGTTNNFFGNTGLKEHVYTLKSTSEALRCRNAVLERLERASVSSHPQERRRLLTFVVIGGGPTGVEMAGALGEMKRYIIKREYPGIRPEEVRIILLEGSPCLLGAMSAKAQHDALRDLGSLMVDVRLGTLMKNYEDGVITLADGTTIDSETVIWTAGITGTPFEIVGSNLRQGPGGRFVTDDCCRVEGAEGVYALGDIGIHITDNHPRGLPQLAQVAIQQGVYLARCLSAGKFERPFRYKDKGTMATIGRNRAVVDMGRIHVGGLVAWLMWMFVHLMSLLGMRNRVIVLINWIWSYFTFNTSLRLLIIAARLPRRRGPEE